MAEPSKPKRSKATRPKAKPATKKVVEDAVVVEETTQASDGGETPTQAEAEGTPNQTTGEEPGVLIEDPQQPDDTPAVETKDVEPDTTAPAVVNVVPASPEPRQSGFPGLVIGGVVAAAIGAGALYFVQSRGWIGFDNGSGDLTALIEAQSKEIAGLKATLSTTSADLETLRAELPAVTTAVSTVSESVAGMSTQVSGLDTAIAAVNERITGIEMQPIPKAELPAEVVAAYETQMASMLETVDGRFAGMQTKLDTRLAELDAAQATATATEEAALKAADLAAARAAMAQVQVALDSGAAFGDQLDVIAEKAGADIPAALTAASEGVPTLAALKTSFPDVARAALTASTRAGASDGSVSPIAAFFRTQLGARSLAPREGDDPDAVLSRAEAAVGAGDLDKALSEIAALPQPGQDALTDWVAQVDARRIALSAASDLAATFETN